MLLNITFLHPYPIRCPKYNGELTNYSLGLILWVIGNKSVKYGVLMVCLYDPLTGVSALKSHQSKMLMFHWVGFLCLFNKFFFQRKIHTKYFHFPICFCLFDLILYVPSTIFQKNRDGSSWVEPVLS